VRALCLLVAVLLAISGAPAAADTGFTVEERVPLGGGNTNDCTGEFFAISGYFHTKVHMSVTLDGRTNVTTEFNLESVQGVAVVTGARYVETAETSTMSNSDADGIPQTKNYEADVRMTRLGEDGIFVAGDDSYSRILVHFTVNANGTTTVNRADVTAISCR
jgi:hypothetical protein